MELAAKTLTHRFVRLEPLEERHREGHRAAGADPSIWRMQPFNIAQGFDAYFDWILREQAHGRWMPHAVIAADGRHVGQSCYLNVRPRDAGVEIGGTWYAPDAQGTAINPGAKYLLLSHAFESGAERVDLKTDANNARSRRAMEKLGCTFEGVLRRHMRRPDGTLRDTAYYSIIREEWPAVRAGLEVRLAAFDA